MSLFPVIEMKKVARVGLAVLCAITIIQIVIEFSHHSHSPERVNFIKRSQEKKPNEEDSLFFWVDIKKEQEQSIRGGPTDHLTEYKNPCWVTQLLEAFPYKKNGYRTLVEFYPHGSKFSVRKSFQRISDVYAKRLQQGEKWRLRCLPYIYLVGVTKSGTSDLFENIIKHPQVIAGAIKEPMWWNRKRIGRARKYSGSPYSFSDYIDLFDNAAEVIRTTQATFQNGTEYHPTLTIDGTPAYLWDYDGWQMIPGNIGLQEPRYILAHSLKSLVPQAKIIAIIRDPVDRLFSQFRMKRGYADPEIFHRSVVAALQEMKRCLDNRTLRSCVYDASVNPREFKPKNKIGSVFLRASLYYVYIADWLSVFPRDQFLVIRAEDYYNNRSTSLAAIFKFLGLQQTVADFMTENSRIVNRVRRSKQMLNTTRVILNEFYKPYNMMLAKLLNDRKFLWNR